MLVKTFEHHRDDLRCLSIERSQLVSSSTDGGVIVYDLEPGLKIKKSLFRCKKPIMCHCSFTIGGVFGILLSALDSRVLLLSDSGEVRTTVNLDPGEYLTVISKSLSTFWCGSSKGRLFGFQVFEGGLRQVSKNDCHENTITSVICDDIIFTSSRDNQVKVWSAKVPIHMIRRVTCRYRSGINSMLLLNQRKLLIVSGDYEIRFFQQHDLSSVRVISEAHDGYVSELKELDFNRIISSSQDHTARIWNINTGNCEKVLKDDNITCWVNCVAVWKSMVFTGGNDGSLRMWRFEDNVQKKKKVNDGKKRIPFGKASGNVVQAPVTIKRVKVSVNQMKKRKRSKSMNRKLENDKDGALKKRKID